MKRGIEKQNANKKKKESVNYTLNIIISGKYIFVIEISRVLWLSFLRASDVKQGTSTIPEINATQHR
jgi:hypothetical protein